MLTKGVSGMGGLVVVPVVVLVVVVFGGVVVFVTGVVKSLL